MHASQYEVFLDRAEILERTSKEREEKDFWKSEVIRLTRLMQVLRSMGDKAEVSR